MRTAAPVAGSATADAGLARHGWLLVAGGVSTSLFSVGLRTRPASVPAA